MELYITSRLVIPSNELNWNFSRSSGAGGQNINKTDSKVELAFNIETSKVFTNFQKARLLEKLKNRLVKKSIKIVVQTKRTQYQNRKLALKKLGQLIKEGLQASSKPRLLTKPTRSSQEKRIEIKTGIT